MSWPEPTLFLWALFVVTALGALLRVRIESREDHVILTVAGAVDAAILGVRSLALVGAAALVAVPLIWLWNCVPPNRARLGPRRALQSTAWLALSLVALLTGFL